MTHNVAGKGFLEAKKDKIENLYLADFYASQAGAVGGVLTQKKGNL